MASGRAPNRPNMGRRYRPAPPVGETDHSKTHGRKLVFYARKSTIAYTEVVQEEPSVLRDSWSFSTYFDWCYGLPLVTDPRDFIPDTFVSWRSQVLEWQSAVRAVENGLIPMSPKDFPPFANPWGIGISLIRKETGSG